MGFKCQHIVAPGLPGGWHQGVVNDLVKKSASFGLDAVNARCNCLYRKSITHIKSVQEQVVAGLKMKITIGLVDSICRNSGATQGKGLKECPAQSNAAPKECDMTILYQGWMTPKFHLLEHTC